jgi:hypothetical protein
MPKIDYVLLSGSQLSQMSVKDSDGELYQDDDYRDYLMETHDGNPVRCVCRDGHPESPEDNILGRHYDPLVSELQRLAEQLNRLKGA